MASKLKILDRSLLIWLLIIIIETINGTTRDVFLSPVIGGRAAKAVSFGTAILLVTSITYLSIYWIRASNAVELLGVGILWALLTFAFEIVISVGVAGRTWERSMADLNPFSEGLMGFGLIFLVFVPLFIYRIRATISPERTSG